MIALLLAALSLTLHFYRLGAWPFAGDEPHTTREAASLMGEIDFASTSQLYRLPRMLPVAYSLLWCGYELFGRDEFGARVVPALLGALQVPAVYLLLRPRGRPVALACGLLIAGWWTHLFFSQQNRFYSPAAFFVLLALLFGWRALEKMSAAWMSASVFASLLAFGSHSIQGSVLGVVAGAYLLAYLRFRRLGARASVLAMAPPGLTESGASARGAWSFRVRNFELRGSLGLAVVIVGIAVGLAVALGHVLPLAGSWNKGHVGYDPGHALVSVVASVGWPTLILAGVGLCDVVRRSRPEVPFWVLALLALLGTALIVPRFVVFRHAYAYPFEIVPVLLAGFGVGLIYRSLRRINRPAATVCFVGLCAIHLPSTVSYYRDGGRYDHRSTAEYLHQHIQARDPVLSFAPNVDRLYFPEHAGRISLLDEHNPLPGVKKALGSLPPGQDLWLSLHKGRGGIPGTWISELAELNCRSVFEKMALHYDYYEFHVYVFRCSKMVRCSEMDGSRTGSESGWSG